MLKAYIKTAIPCENCAKKIIETIQPIQGIGSIAVDMQNSEIAVSPTDDCAEIMKFNLVLNQVQERLTVIDKIIQGVRYE